MNMPENPERYPDNSQAAQVLGSSALEHTHIRLDKVEFDGDMSQYYEQKAQGFQKTFEAGSSLSAERYIEFLEAIARDAQEEFLALAEFHGERAKKDRARVNEFLSRSLQESNT